MKKMKQNVILVCLSLQQNVTIFPLRSKPPIHVSQHRIICIWHVYGNHFVQVSFISSLYCPSFYCDVG